MDRLTIGLALALLVAGPAGAQEQQERSGIDKVGDTAERVAEQPLRDLNLMKAKIPPELAAISAEPYSLAGVRTCAQLAAAIGTMNRVLGADVDSAAARNAKETPAEFALGAGASVAGSFIPGGGLIRKISGAEAQQKRAAAAVLSGQVRRAYLKGTARAKGCRV